MLSDGPPPVSAAQHARNRRLVRDALAASGVLDKLRAQIRSSVAHEVLHRSPPDDKLIIDDRTRAMDSLVFSYLAERGLELAASVMLAECGLGTANAVLSENGIVAVLGMGKLDGHGGIQFTGHLESWISQLN